MRSRSKILSLLLCFALMLAVFSVPSQLCVHAAARTGTVNTASDPLNVRSGPGSEYSKIGSIPKGERVTVNDTSHPGWYNVTYGSLTGYVSSAYIKLDIVYTPDTDFEEYLTEQGFPESYKNGLRTLHAAHPNWIFTANKVNLKWSDVIKGESELGTSLVQKLASYPEAYFSYQQGAYNPSTGKHEVFDGTNWVQASEELIKYSVDPRNYFTESYIFAFLSLSYSSNESVSNINSILKGTFMEGAYPAEFDEYATYADAFLAAAKEAKVSSYHLASRCRQEQGVKGSTLSRGDVAGYEGYYNFFNINAYNSGSLSNVQMGAKYAQSQGWNTPYKSILGGAQFLAKGYISIGQDTLYMQKFDLVSLGGYYVHQYMSNVLAPFSEAGILKNALTADVLASGLTFSIPVFNDMPASACAKPSGLGNNNYLLKSLNADKYPLTPAFSPYTYSYELVVDSSVSSVSISAAADSQYATVTGSGTKKLEYGDNSFSVTVTAQSGTKRTYSLIISRQQPHVDPVIPDPAIKGTKYQLGTYITGIGPDTSVTSFIKDLAVENGTVSVTDAGGKAKSSGNICSGDKVRILKTDGSEYLNYETVIYGDINGDGKISTVDLFMGQRRILDTYELSGARLAAADINHDGRLTTVDLFMGQRHILGTYTITQ